MGLMLASQCSGFLCFILNLIILEIGCCILFSLTFSVNVTKLKHLCQCRTVIMPIDADI